MRMVEPAGRPARKWFQFHLFTVVVLLFVASGLAWLERTPESYDRDSYGYGWPFKAYDLITSVIEWPGLFRDVAFTLGILAAVTTGCELIVKKKIQIHLSTAFAVMLMASLLIWAHVEKRAYGGAFRCYGQGWPDVWLVWYLRDDNFPDRFSRQIRWHEFYYDLVIALAILAAVATVCELIVRRKKHV